MKNISELLNVTKMENATPDDWTPGDELLNVTNMTSLNNTWIASLPNGLNFTTPAAYTVLTVDGGDVDIRKPEFYAFEVLFHACVQSIETEYHEGQSISRIVSSSNIPLDIPDNKPAHNTRCTLKPNVLEAGPPHQKCRSGDDHVSLSYLQDPKARDNKTSHYSLNRYIAGDIVAHLTLDIENYFAFANSWNGSMCLSSQDLAVVDALWGSQLNANYTTSQQARGSGQTLTGPRLRSNPTSSQILNGTAWREQSYVSIDWGWSAFLAAKILFSYTFLGITMYRTLRLNVPVLKAIGNIDNIKEADKKANMTHVRLDGNQLTLVQAK
ncbi:hypothetical protein QBC35DRAFT_453679 [Podospora australis]|uniref:Uncharacterized protein n=1 Tax=Podospora australis TaxID=1536484 RepID=A0AAN6WPM5_9PEZI|nr:hypothetical protein QBC35DRAFT_453679 [Podospora australis]